MLSQIDEILNSLAGNKYFSVLDMNSGYHQIEIAKDHKARTALLWALLNFLILINELRTGKFPSNLSKTSRTMLR